MKNRFGKLGFTLIEILIVITIIGILAVVFLPSILGAPQKARDARRIADVKTISDSINAGLNDGLILASASSTCLTSDLAGLAILPFLTYFPNETVPLDPTGSPASWNLRDTTPNCPGQYYFRRYTTGDYKYGVFAQVEDAKNANINCASGGIQGNTPSFFEDGGTLPASCDGSTNARKCCYGVRF